MKDITVVINGAGAAGIAIGTFLLNMGIGNLIMVDINGIINKDDRYENPAHAEIATKTNNNNIKGGHRMSACAALSVSVLPAFQSVFQPAFVRQLSVLLAVP